MLLNFCKDTHILLKSLYLVFGRYYHYCSLLSFVLKHFDHILVATHKLAASVQHSGV